MTEQGSFIFPTFVDAHLTLVTQSNRDELGFPYSMD